MQERLAYEVYLNIKLVRIFSSGAHLGEVETEKSIITLKYATDAERIINQKLNYSFMKCQSLSRTWSKLNLQKTCASI